MMPPGGFFDLRILKSMAESLSYNPQALELKEVDLGSGPNKKTPLHHGKRSTVPPLTRLAIVLYVDADFPPSGDLAL